MAETTFKGWLTGEMRRQDVTRRGLARRLASQHPEGVNEATVETYRRAIYKYLHSAKPTKPTNPTRAAFAVALGVSPDEVPSSEDEEEAEDVMAPLMREVMRLQKQIQNFHQEEVRS